MQTTAGFRIPLLLASFPMEAVGPKEIHRILEVTDSLHIHREAVRIPLETAGEGSVRGEGDVVQIVAPATSDFEEWIGGLISRLRNLDLSKVRKSDS